PFAVAAGFLAGVACGSTNGTSGDDGGTTCTNPSPVWETVETPARAGTLVGADGDVLVIDKGLSDPGGSYVSPDGATTWLPARNPGPQDAGPVGPIRDMIVDPRVPGSFWVLEDWSTQQFTFHRTADADFAPSSLGWPIAPDYL